jgi:hypothetical protein
MKVRLRHQWVALITMPLTEEQAATMAVGGWDTLKPQGEKSVSYGGPVCWRCEQGWEQQSYSCASTSQ